MDDKYLSRRQRRRLLHAAFVRKRVSVVHHTFTDESARPIDGSIIFLSFDSNQVILSYEDAMVLTLGVDKFATHKILVNPGSSANFL